MTDKEVKALCAMTAMEHSLLRGKIEKWVETFNAFPRAMLECVVSQEPYKWEEITANIDADGDDYYDDDMPIWNTMWQFGRGADERWLSSSEGLETMTRLGFRVFRHKDFGDFFGIDASGCDFIDDYWLPLYLERGLLCSNNAE